MTDHQAPNNLVVIGASAGGIPPLLTLVEGLPDDFRAAVLIVMHIPAGSKSRLPDLLQRVTPLPVAAAEDQEVLAAGHIYVAPPDRHLLVRQDHLALSRGPRENHTRPAVDPLFRSAARSWDSRVIGVVLSGTLYDGSAGLMAIKAAGGYAVVQDPDEAVMSGMPASAVATAVVDEVLPAARLAGRLVELVSSPATLGQEAHMHDDDGRTEAKIADDFALQAHDDRPDEITMFTCPDCGGVMWQEGAGDALRFRCHVGHAYNPELLMALKSEGMEGALWACVRLLKEKATLTRQLAARRTTVPSSAGAVREMEEQAQTDEQYVEVLKRLLERTPSPAD